MSFRESAFAVIHLAAYNQGHSEGDRHYETAFANLQGKEECKHYREELKELGIQNINRGDGVSFVSTDEKNEPA